VAGAATPFLQAVLSGRTPSLDDVISGGASGAVLGRLPNEFTAPWIDRMTPRAKGKLGEGLSMVDAWITGHSAFNNNVRSAGRSGPVKLKPPETYQPAGGGRRESGYTIPDVIASPWFGLDDPKAIESKFGPDASLSKNKNQSAAFREFPRSEYVVQHSLARDVGNYAGVGLVGIDPFRPRGVPIGSPFVLDSRAEKRHARRR
jgi:hypothetical protein